MSGKGKKITEATKEKASPVKRSPEEIMTEKSISYQAIGT